MMELGTILQTLAARRPIFHSEADFQFALAWEIQRRLPEANIRLEVPVRGPGGTRYVDLWVWSGGATLAIELKYPTRKLSLQIAEERFDLVNQDAQDLGRYDFIKDIERLEAIAQADPSIAGIALLLTNDPAFWTPARDRETADEAFRIDEGRQLHGVLDWRETDGSSTRHGRQRPLELRGRYGCVWNEYSQAGPDPYARFRWLAMTLRGGG